MRKELFGLVGVVAALMLATAGSVAPSAIGAGTAQNFIVLYKSESVPTTAAKTIQQAGGTLAYSYGQIGVAIATRRTRRSGATCSRPTRRSRAPRPQPASRPNWATPRRTDRPRATS